MTESWLPTDEMITLRPMQIGPRVRVTAANKLYKADRAIFAAALRKVSEDDLTEAH